MSLSVCRPKKNTEQLDLHCQFHFLSTIPLSVWSLTTMLSTIWALPIMALPFWTLIHMALNSWLLLPCHCHCHSPCSDPRLHMHSLLCPLSLALALMPLSLLAPLAVLASFVGSHGHATALVCSGVHDIVSVGSSFHIHRPSHPPCHCHLYSP